MARILCLIIIVSLFGGWTLRADAGEYTVLGRYATGSLTYGVDQLDMRYRSTTRVMVDTLSFELRLKEMRLFSKPWKLESSLQLDLTRQQVFGDATVTPKGRLRVSYGRESFGTLRWRFASLLQLHAGEYLLLDVRSPSSTNSEVISRKGIALGPSIAFRERNLAKFVGGLHRDFIEITANGLVRYDLSETTTILPTELQSSIGFEGEIGLQLWIQKNTCLEFRYRHLYEAYRWQSTTRAPLNNSTTNTFQYFEIGIGKRF